MAADRPTGIRPTAIRHRSDCVPPLPGEGERNAESFGGAHAWRLLDSSVP